MLLIVVNDPRPFNLTVGDLRAALDEAHPDAIVTLSLSPESVFEYVEAATAGLTILLNVAFEHPDPGSRVFRLKPHQ